MAASAEEIAGLKIHLEVFITLRSATEHVVYDIESRKGRGEKEDERDDSGKCWKQGCME